MFRNQIIYIPYVTEGLNANDYIIKTLYILNKHYIVRGQWIKEDDLLNILRTKAIILNWVEAYLNDEMKKLIKIYKRFGVHVIWVFHNKISHDESSCSVSNIEWLAANASTIIIHSNKSKSLFPEYMNKMFYIPIIECEFNADPYYSERIRNSYSIRDNDFVFLLSGYIRPYKQYERVVKAFRTIINDDVKLIVVGDTDEEYGSELINLAEGDGRIFFDFRFVTDYELCNIYSVIDVALIPYSTNTTINSGVIINAFSCGKTVISSKFCMSEEYYEMDLLELFDDNYRESIQNAINKGKKYYRTKGEKCKKYINDNNNASLVERYWEELLKC